MPPLSQGDGCAVLSLIEIDETYGCWRWAGVHDRDGYARYPDKRGKLAHRTVFEMLVGPATGKELDHVCRRRNCVNPGHLEPVTRNENMRRVGRAGWKRLVKKTVCSKGHDLFRNGRRTPEGGKVCLICSKEHSL